MPEVGELVTVVIRSLFPPPAPSFSRGIVDGRLDRAFDPGTGRWSGMIGFGVKLEDALIGRANLWEVDSDFVEGVGWARGWDGPAVEALKAAQALV